MPGITAVLEMAGAAALLSWRSITQDGDDGIEAELAAVHRATKGAGAYFSMVLPPDDNSVQGRESSEEATDTLVAVAQAWIRSFTFPSTRQWEMPLLSFARALLLGGAWEMSGGNLLLLVMVGVSPVFDRYVLNAELLRGRGIARAMVDRGN